MLCILGKSVTWQYAFDIYCHSHYLKSHMQFRPTLLISPKYSQEMFHSLAINWVVLCQKQISRSGTSNYIPQILWDVITFPYTWYLLLAYTPPTWGALCKFGVWYISYIIYCHIHCSNAQIVTESTRMAKLWNPLPRVRQITKDSFSMISLKLRLQKTYCFWLFFFQILKF